MNLMNSSLCLLEAASAPSCYVAQVVCYDYGATPRGPKGGYQGVGRAHPQGRGAGAEPRSRPQAGPILQVCLPTCLLIRQ